MLSKSESPILMTSGSNRVVELSTKEEPEPEGEEVIIKNYTSAVHTPVPEPAAAPPLAEGLDLQVCMTELVTFW